jgi:squalene synthase HpnC
MVMTRRPASAPPGVDSAFDWCRHYARQRRENFTVVSGFLPRDLRPHFFALYAFCRMTDDLGDEAEGDRLALLDAWEEELRQCFAGARRRPLFVALGATADRFAIPPDPFLRLIEANRIDQRVSRFATYAELLDYCSYSAAPVGEMVLYVLGYSDERRQSLGASTCIGLQLANFWQDVSVDIGKGRVYIPQEDMQRLGVDESEIARGHDSDASRALIQFEVARTHVHFDRGRELEPLVDRRARTDVRLFRLGGEAILDAIEASNYNVLSARPTIPAARKAWMALSAGARMKLGL